MGRHHPPVGRGRGVAADVRGYPDPHRPAAGATRAGVTGRWGQLRRTTRAEVRLDHRKRRVPASTGGQSDGLAANGGGCDRISLRRCVNETENYVARPGLRGYQCKIEGDGI